MKINEIEYAAIGRLSKSGASSIKYPSGFNMEYARIRVSKVLQTLGIRRVIGVSIVENAIVLWDKVRLGKGKATTEVQELAFQPESSVVASVYTKNMIAAALTSPRQEVNSEVAPGQFSRSDKDKMLRYLERKLASGHLTQEKFEELKARLLGGSVHVSDTDGAGGSVGSADNQPQG